MPLRPSIACRASTVMRGGRATASHKTAKTLRSSRGLACSRRIAANSSEGLSMLLLLGSRFDSPAHEVLHFFQGNEAIFVGIHRLEDALVGRLELL